MSWWKRSKAFCQETVAEMKKVSYPSWDEVVGTTTVVLVATAVFGVFLYLADIVIVQVYDAIIGFFRS